MISPRLLHRTLIAVSAAVVVVLAGGTGVVVLDDVDDPDASPATEDGTEVTETVDESEDTLDEIPAGEREVRLELDADAAVGGELTRGDRVDIWGVFDAELLDRLDISLSDEEASEPVAMALLQNVRVFDVESSDETPEATSFVSMSLTPEEGELVQLVRRTAAVRLARRAADDMETFPVARTTLSTALDDVDALHTKRGDELDRFANDPDVEIERNSSSLNLRTITLRVDAPTGTVAGPRPGDRIDLFGVFLADHHPDYPTHPSDEAPQYVSVDLTQHVEVVDIDGQLLTVAATPDEIETLLLTEHRGELVARVRNPGDLDPIDPDEWTARELFRDVTALAQHREQRFDDAFDDTRDSPQIRIERDEHDNIVEDETDTGQNPADQLLERLVDPVDETSSVGGLLVGERAVGIDLDALSDNSVVPEAGDWIDVAATIPTDGSTPTGTPDDGHPPYVTTTSLQRMPVLDVDGNNLSVSVSPDEAHLLAQASRMGRLDLHRRHADDTGISPAEPTTLSEIFDTLEIDPERCDCRPPRPDGAPPRPEEDIEIIR